jgi:hypothetical protein
MAQIALFRTVLPVRDLGIRPRHIEPSACAMMEDVGHLECGLGGRLGVPREVTLARGDRSGCSLALAAGWGVRFQADPGRGLGPRSNAAFTSTGVVYGVGE